MNIYLRTRTMYTGETLKGDLRHLDKFIQNELAKASFQSSFETLSITLAYPPLIIPSYPYLRLKRKQKQISVCLNAAEITQQEDAAALAKKVLDLFIEAGELIAAKTKKEDNFPIDLFKQTLLHIRSTIDIGHLAAINKQETENAVDARITRALAIREKRRGEDKPKDTPIRALRIYFHPHEPPKTLYPFDYQYSAIFRQALTKVQLKCPGYHHLYIQVAATKEEALMHCLAIEDWYVDGIAVLDLDAYKAQTNEQKAQTVFDLIVEGLMDIARIDNLDIDKINEAIAAVREKGLDTELVFKIVDHKNYQLVISFIPRSMEEGSPVFFNLIEKKTDRLARLHIGNATHFEIPWWLQNVTITNKQIKVKASDSIRGQVWRGDKPAKMEFDIAKMFEQ